MYLDLLDAGGSIEILSATEAILLVPHHKCDAFGGIFLLNSFFSKNLDSPDGTPKQDFGEIPYNGMIFEFSTFKRAQNIGSEYTPSDKTFLQLFIQKLTAVPEIQQFDRIAFPVCLDDLGMLSSESVWGNSLTIITFKFDELEQLPYTSKDLWRSTFANKATKVVEFLKRRPSQGPLKKTLLVSSIGCLDKYNWANRINPRTVNMIPTPLSEDSVNIILWSSSLHQTISFCYNSNFWATELRDVIHKKWEGLIDECF